MDGFARGTAGNLAFTTKGPEGTKEERLIHRNFMLLCDFVPRWGCLSTGLLMVAEKEKTVPDIGGAKCTRDTRVLPGDNNSTKHLAVSATWRLTSSW